MDEQPDGVVDAMELLLAPCLLDDDMSQRSRRMGREGVAAEPFLVLMVEALFIFIGVSTDDRFNYNNAVGEVTKHAMDAITSVFKDAVLDRKPRQKTVIDLILIKE